MGAAGPLSENPVIEPASEEKPIKLGRIWLVAGVMLLLVFGAAFIANQTRSDGPDYVLLPMPPSVHDLIGRMDSILSKNVLLQPRAAIWSANFCGRTIRPWVPILVINTQPGSRRYRDIIRRVLKPSVLSSMDVVFTCGLAYGNETLVTDLKAEVDEHEDLIVGEFMDKPNSTYNEGPAVGMVIVNQCLERDRSPSRIYINVSEFTPVNYRNLADWVIAAQAVPNWNDLAGSPGFENLTYHNTTGGRAAAPSTSKSLLSRWQDVNLDGGDGEKKVLAIPHSTFISTMSVINDICSNLKDFHGYCAKRKFQRNCLKESMWQMIGDMTHEGKIRPLSSEQLGVDKLSICEDEVCDCDSWLTLEDEDETTTTTVTSAVKTLADVYRKCPDSYNPLELSTKSKYTGLAGTPLQGPAVTEFTSHDEFCSSIKGGAVVGVLTKSNDFKVRENLREWFEKHETDLKPVFPIGRNSGAEGKSVHDKLEEELEKYHDLIIGDYYDRYETLSTKTIMLMKWFNQCTEKNEDLHWLIKSDADVMTHPKANTELLDHLWNDGIIENELSKDRKTSIFRAISALVSPAQISNAQSGMAIKPEDFPFWIGSAFRADSMGVITQTAHRNYEDINLEVFPAYCSGPYYIVSRRLAQIVLKNRLHPDLKNLYFRNEDAMIGIIIQHWNDHRAGGEKEKKSGASKPDPEEEALRKITPDMPIYPMKSPGIFCLDVNPEAGVCAGFKLTITRGNRLQQCQCSKVLSVPNSYSEQMENLIDRCHDNKFDKADLSNLDLSLPYWPPETLPKLINIKFPHPTQLDKKTLEDMMQTEL